MPELALPCERTYLPQAHWGYARPLSKIVKNLHSAAVSPGQQRLPPCSLDDGGQVGGG